MCWADTQVKPIEAEDHAIGLVKYENRRLLGSLKLAGPSAAGWTCVMK
jgi:hypothetical protein